ncbi:MAG: ABC transporter permease [Muribaculaceae bacterium]|nr:ABC transporter permease [Muribaculaceae bacterium]
MFKIIISNLWRRRRQNLWLFIELIIVSILTWVIADPTLVKLYDVRSEQGYDTDRTVFIEMGIVPFKSAKFDNEAWTPDGMTHHHEIILSRLKNMPDVENAARIYNVLGGDSFSFVPTITEWQKNDSTFNWTPFLRVYRNSDFFNVYGIEAAEGYPSIKDVEANSLSDNDIVITETLDREVWGDRPGLKDKYFLVLLDRGDYVDTIRNNVVGVVKDFHINSFMRTKMNIIQLSAFDPADLQLPPKIIVRLKEGIDAGRFATEHLENISDMLRIGNLYVKSVCSQKAFLSKTEAIRGVTSSLNLSIIVACLFLINLILGVVGCVWLQTGKRVKEVGVLRSYGAMRKNIVGMLIGESVVMATIAVIIGCVIYLQYALKEGLSNGVINNDTVMQQHSWVTDFGCHFATVSAVVYALIIICVVIGTFFPARHVSRVEPVDALRDE